MDMSVFTTFQGRIGRQTFWLSLLAMLVIQMILFGLIWMLFGPKIDPNMAPDDPAAVQAMLGLMVPMGIIGLVFLWPALAINAKRWHDRGKSAWWILIQLVPVVGPIWNLIETGFLRGTEGPNQYGPDPLGGR